MPDSKSDLDKFIDHLDALTAPDETDDEGAGVVGVLTDASRMGEGNTTEGYLGGSYDPGEIVEPTPHETAELTTQSYDFMSVRGIAVGVGIWQGNLTPPPQRRSGAGLARLSDEEMRREATRQCPPDPANETPLQYIHRRDRFMRRQMALEERQRQNRPPTPEQAAHVCRFFPEGNVWCIDGREYNIADLNPAAIHRLQTIVQRHGPLTPEELETFFREQMELQQARDRVLYRQRSIMEYIQEGDPDE